MQRSLRERRVVRAAMALARTAGAGRGLAILLVAVGGLAGPALADVRNMGPGLTSLETVPVGNAGNAADSTGYGSVGYEYRIGKYEVTAGQYTEFLNAVAGVDTYLLYHPNMAEPAGWQGCNIQRSGEGTPASPYTYSVAPDWANRPVNWVSFGDVLRFANWLHNGQPGGAQDASTTEDGAYTLTQGNTVTRNANWQWAVASEDEWYKAAYYDPNKPGGAGYWFYPTRSNTVPSNARLTPDGGNNANFNNYDPFDPYNITSVGEFELSYSPYGTFDQGGNVCEWTDTEIQPSSAYRVVRGGYFGSPAGHLHSSFREEYGWPAHDMSEFGFRVVQVPEPATLAVLAVGGLLMARRRRVRQTPTV